MAAPDDALDLLRRADPVAIDLVSEGRSGEARALLERITGRPPRRSRPTLVLAAAVVAAVVAGSAVAITRIVTDFVASGPAPEHVQVNFARMDVFAPKGMETGVIAGQARMLQVPLATGGTRVLYVAPTKKGGFCIETPSTGGCRAERKPPPSAVPALERQGHNSWSVGVTGHGNSGGLTALSGDLLDPETRQVMIEFEDGRREEIPFAWVSSPIDAGFWYYDIPEDRRAEGRRPSAVVALDEDGDELARSKVEQPDLARMWRPPGVPGYAVEVEKRALIRIRTTRGRELVLWVSPSRDGGRCHWTTSGGGCTPPDAPPPDAHMFPGLATGARPVVLWGAVPTGTTTLELRFQDGEVQRVTPTEGWVLAEITPDHYPRGHRLARMIALGAGGEEIGHEGVVTDQAGMYPCEGDEQIELGLGVKGCP